MARTPASIGLGRRDFLRLALLGAGTAALGRPRWAAADELTGLDGDPAGVAVQRGRAIAVGTDRAGRAAAWWSTDAIRWERAIDVLDATAILGDVTAVSGGFMAVGSAAGHPAAWWSADGTGWELLTALPRPGHLVAVAAVGRTALAGGARQDGESDEGTGALLASIDRSGAWGTLTTRGVGDLAHGSITAVARHGARWVLAGTATGSSGLWRSTARGRWSPALSPGREPVLWSSLLSTGSSLVALGATVAGGVVQLARSDDARSWRHESVPAALAALGVDLRGGSYDGDTGGAIVAGATGAVARIVDGLPR